ncbi:MAG: hypothetical protein MHPDNHAH_00382 [Anaerolineales bacterium]|nr:hypothetical protein [Anaerolineales bacterium]
MTIVEIAQIILAVITTLVAIVVSIQTRKLVDLQIKLEKQRLESEENTKSIQDRQKQMVDEISDFRNALLTQTLSIAPQVAFAPYPQLFPSINPSDMSLFERRIAHFAPEKESLAEAIVKIISNEIVNDKELEIILVLDAGSTVYPIFRQLCAHPNFQFDRTNAQRLKIITNNLPGVSALIKYGHIGDPISARTLFKCQVLTGYAHSQYEATLSDQTAADLRQAVTEYKKITSESQNSKVKIISVTSGNYVSLTDGVLARDRNHVETKSTMLDIGDDVYILAPLGKLLPYSCTDINHLLGYSDENGYAAFPNWLEKSKKLTMVITERSPEYFPQLRPHTLIAYFGRIQAEVKDLFENRLISLSFDPMDDVRVRVQASVLGIDRALRDYELPHRNLRERLIAKLG